MTSVPLPVSTREMRHPDFSTSDEDDDEVLGSPVGRLVKVNTGQGQLVRFPR